MAAEIDPGPDCAECEDIRAAHGPKGMPDPHLGCIHGFPPCPMVKGGDPMKCPATRPHKFVPSKRDLS